MKRLVLALACVAITPVVFASPLSIAVKAHAIATSGIHGYDTAVACRHEVSITNPTGADEFPTVFYRVCVQGGECQVIKFTQKVNNGTFTHQYQNVMYHTFRSAGHYTVYCSTSVDQAAQVESTADINVT